MRTRTVIVMVGICATLSGCGGSGVLGGSEQTLTRTDVERQGRLWIKAQTRTQKKKVSVAAPRCFEDPDPRHWRCAIDLHGTAGATTHITFTATCDSDSCRYKIVYRA
jgi:hypothetical protein